MATRPSCSLCGAPFKAHGTAVDAGGRDRQWNSRVRGIRGDKSSLELGNPFLTGPGYISGGQIVATLDADAVDLADNTAENRYDMGIYGDARPIIYALHEFCWHLLLERIGVSPRDSRSVAAWLFHVLAALPYSRAGGLITRDGYSGGSVDSAEIRHADPSVHIFSGLIDDTVLPDEIKAPKSLFKSRQQPAVGDPFSRLPLEIMHDVFDFLSSVDLCAARLASRSFADCAAPAALPQRFWSGRFAPDKEMGFIDLETAKPRLPSIANDYYQYYRKCQQALRAEVIPEGLINRRRIWGCLDHFAVTLRALLSVRGDGTGNVFPQPPRLPNVHSLGQVVSCPELSSATAGPGSLVFGARIRHKEILVIDRNPPIYCPILLEFSTIDFDGRRYISGLQLSAGTDSYHCVGLMVPSATAPVSLEPETSIYEIDVYMSIAGIHGIIIHAKTPDGRETAHAVGDTEPAKDSDTAVTRLEARGNILGFSLGFDMFKLASLQLIDTTAPSDWVPPTSQVLWKSALPPKNSHQPTHSQPSDDPLTLSSFLTHLYIPFGGEDGSRLPSLLRITALLDGAIGLHGLIFIYDNEDQVLYGNRVSPRFAGPSRICVEQSFLIDGPGGERLDQLIYSSRTGSDALRIGYPGISAMEVVTNFNRRHTFRAFDNYGNIRTLMHQRTPRLSPNGRCPTVLTVGLGAPAWFFETAEMSDFVSLPETGPLAIEADAEELAPTDQILASCPWMLSVGGSCFTTASLADVQRVRISAGAHGRSRDEFHISGLWFEYRSRVHDTIVGQWMTELDQFTLGPQETLIEISVRATKDIDLRGTGGAVGKVVCLTFVTSLENRYEFRRSEASAESHVQYCATPYEDLGTFTWAFNSNTDDIQISLEPAKALGQDGHLLLCDADIHLRHPWLLQETTRIFFKYGDLQPRKIGRDVSIHRGDAARRYTSACNILFWEERDPKGSGRMLRLRKIEVMGRDGIVDGFRFEYEDNLVRSFGCQDSEKHVLDFTKHKDEKPSCLVVHYITDSRSALEIHTTRGKVCRVFPESETSNQADSHALTRGAGAPELTLTANHQSRAHHDFPDRNPSGNPISDCVGIWVTGPPRHQSTIPYVESFGPVYRTRPQLQTEQGDGKSGLRQTLRGLLRRDA